MKTIRLEQIQIATPCTESWQEMTGDARKRFCGQCDKHVHDLTNFSRAEAEKLIGDSDHICVRMRCDDQGRVITADDFPMSRTRRFLARNRLTWVSGLLIMAMGFVTACEQVVMGEPMPKPEPPCTQERPPLMGIVAPTTRKAVPPPPNTPPATQPDSSTSSAHE